MSELRPPGSSELRPPTPARRPESARSREDAEPPIEPPTSAELSAIQRHLCSLPAHSGAIIEDDADLNVLVVRRPAGEVVGPEGDYVAQPRWSVEEWQERLARVDRQMRDRGAWPSLLLADRLDRPPGLDRDLAGVGWVRVHAETVFWVGRASVVPHLDPRLRIEAVQPRSVATHETLERRVFGFPDGHAQVRREVMAVALATGRLRAFVVWLEDTPVAVARLSQGDGVAGIYAVGVAEERRGQGFGTLVTTIATRAGMALGNRLVWLSAREDNAAALAVYGKLGFQRAFGWSRWLATKEAERP